MLTASAKIHITNFRFLLIVPSFLELPGPEFQKLTCDFLGCSFPTLSFFPFFEKSVKTSAIFISTYLQLQTILCCGLGTDQVG